MKNRLLFVLPLVVIAALFTSCTASFPTKGSIVTLTSEKAEELLIDKTEKEIHDKWGEPDDRFSGFYGDIYVYNDKCIGIYYDSDNKVTNVRIWNKEQ